MEQRETQVKAEKVHDNNNQREEGENWIQRDKNQETKGRLNRQRNERR